MIIVRQKRFGKVKKSKEKDKNFSILRSDLCRDKNGKYEITHYADGAKKYTYFDKPDMNHVILPNGDKKYFKNVNRDENKEK